MDGNGCLFTSGYASARNIVISVYERGKVQGEWKAFLCAHERARAHGEDDDALPQDARLYIAGHDAYNQQNYWL